MKFLEMYKKCAISFAQGLQVIKAVNTKHLEDDFDFWQKIGDSTTYDTKNYENFLKDLPESTYDWEGYRSRLYLATMLVNNSLLFNNIEKNTLFNFINGKPRTEIESDLKSGLHALRSIIEEGSASASQFRKWWFFCAIDKCPLTGHCMLSIMEDILPIFEIPYFYPSSLSGNLIGAGINSDFNYVFLKFLVDNFSQDPFGWTSVHGIHSKIDTHFKELNLEVTSQVMAYLTLSNQLDNFGHIVNSSSSELHKKWIDKLYATKIEQRCSNQDLSLCDGLWNGWMVSSEHELIKDCSLSVTVHIAKSLIYAYDFLPEESRKSANDHLIPDIIKYCLEKMDKESYLARTYGKDYYLGLSPISDIRGCIQIADLLLELITKKCFANLLNRFDISSPFDNRIRSLILHIIDNQQPSGWWPLLSNECVGKKYEDIKKCLRFDGIESTDKLTDFKIFSEPHAPPINPYNISFDNTLIAMSLIYRYFSMIEIKICPKCNKYTSAFYCADCGIDLSPRWD